MGVTEVGYVHIKITACPGPGRRTGNSSSAFLMLKERDTCFAHRLTRIEQYCILSPVTPDHTPCLASHTILSLATHQALVTHVVLCVCASTEDSVLRQDDRWMLDGDEPQEPLSRDPRPDHLDFLRITPPEDDIIGDTPYCPKLERMVRAYKH